ncbi:MAG: T9SS type A sorting domain-containing protein [Candidatus Stygibacter frigidus]|nr:T9SS type A sorting domain-containing protein [Candidatus Stygibacter frigidus]
MITLNPGEGYKVHAQFDQVFHYPQATRNNVVAGSIKLELKIDYTQYEYTASITAIISGYTPQEGDQLIAYVGDRIAGYASFETLSIIDLNEELGEYYYFIYLYTNELEPADLKLELINTKSSTAKAIYGSYSWQPDSQQGDLENPVILHFEDSQDISEDAERVRKAVIYPNPIRTGSFREQVKINLPMMRNHLNLEAGLYNLRGQKISNLELENKNDYWLIRESNNWNYPNGIYLVNIKSAEFSYQGKLLLLK